MDLAEAYFAFGEYEAALSNFEEAHSDLETIIFSKNSSLRKNYNQAEVQSTLTQLGNIVGLFYSSGNKMLMEKIENLAQHHNPIGLEEVKAFAKCHYTQKKTTKCDIIIKNQRKKMENTLKGQLKEAKIPYAESFFLNELGTLYGGYLSDRILEFKKAEQCFFKAIKVASNAHIPQRTIKSTYHLGRLYYGKTFEPDLDENQKKEYLEKSFDKMRETIAHIEAVRHEIYDTHQWAIDRANFFKTNSYIYHQFIEMLIEQGKFLDALFYLEQAKTRSVLDLKLEEDFYTNTKIQEIFRKKYSYLKGKENSLKIEKSKLSECDDIQVGEWINKADWISLYIELVDYALEYKKSKSRGGESEFIFTSTNCANLFNDETLIIEYFVSEHTKYNYVFLISTKRLGSESKFFSITETQGVFIRLIRLGNYDYEKESWEKGAKKSWERSNGNINYLELKKLFFKWRNVFCQFRLEEQNCGQIEESLNELKQIIGWAEIEQIIEPNGDKLFKNIVFIPHQMLNIFPLHTIMTDNGYIMDRYKVSYSSSLSLLIASTLREGVKNNLKPSRDEMLFVAYNRNNMREEINHIQENCGINGKRLSRKKDKIIDNLFTEAKDCSYLHFACHGHFNFATPIKSKLILYNNKKDASEKVELYAGEIFSGLVISNCHAVILSACETGVLQISTTDEDIGLTTAFIQSGARNVISSLWAVENISTTLLMERFYHYHLKEEQPLIEALYNAQKWLREATAQELAHYYKGVYQRSRKPDAYKWLRHHQAKNPKERPYANAYYWAGFILWGSDTFHRASDEKCV